MIIQLLLTTSLFLLCLLGVVEKLDRTKVHTIYKDSTGKRVPGVTTIIGILDKPALLHWVKKVTLEGKDFTKYRDALGGIGTLVHKMIEFDLDGIDYDFSDECTKNEIDKSSNSFLKYLEWRGGHEVIPELLEESMVSDEGFGGTIDFYGTVDGKKMLMDIKTSKRIYDDNLIQLAAYSHLLEEQGHEVEQVSILRVGRDETEGFEFRTFNMDAIAVPKEIFFHCLAIYNLKKRM